MKCLFCVLSVVFCVRSFLFTVIFNVVFSFRDLLLLIFAILPFAIEVSNVVVVFLVVLVLRHKKTP